MLVWIVSLTGDGGWGDAGVRLDIMSDLLVEVGTRPSGRLLVKSQRQVAIRHGARTCFHCRFNAMIRKGE